MFGSISGILSPLMSVYLAMTPFNKKNIFSLVQLHWQFYLYMTLKIPKI